MIFCNSMLCKGSLPDKVVGFFRWFNGREWTILDKLAKNVLTFCGTKKYNQFIIVLGGNIDGEDRTPKDRDS